MENTQNTLLDDKARAQDIVDAIYAVMAAVEADNQARTGRGGPVQVIQSVGGQLEHQAWQIAQAFDLPWSGTNYGPTVSNVEAPLH